MHDNNLIVTEGPSGIAVVTTAEKAREAIRAKRKARKQAARHRAAQSRTAAQKGHVMWKARAKRITKMANNGGDRKTAKVFLAMEASGHIAKVG